MKKKSKTLFRVRFLDKVDNKTVEVLVKQVSSSEFLGLVVLEDFLFEDSKSHIVLPSEDKIKKQFSETKRLHIPYHNILSIEEICDSKPDVKNLPFLKSIEEKLPS